MNIIGLTGAIGSGKSTFCEQGEKLQIPTIDLDIINRRLLNKIEIQQNLCSLFHLKSEIDLSTLKGKLREILTCPTRKKQLEDYLHPLIFKELSAELEQRRELFKDLILTIPVSSVLNSIPVEFKYKINIEAHRIIKERRLIERYGENNKELIHSLIKLHQEGLSTRASWADRTVFNNLTLDTWKRECQVIIREILENF